MKAKTNGANWIKVPVWTDLILQGKRRPFRTAFKTKKIFGDKYYATVIMPPDLEK